MPKIAFIGLGIMGKAMVRNLIKKGYTVQGWARTPSKVADLAAEGLCLKPSVKEAVADAGIVFTMVGGPADVEDLYFKEGGILGSIGKGTILIDCTSSSPELAQRIYAAAKDLGCEALDLPVSGGEKGAVSGTLSMFAGGDRETLDKVIGILSAVAGTVTYEGKAGCGQHTKLVNQIMVAGQLAGMAEGVAYALEKGLDLQSVLKAVAPGAARCASLDMYTDKILAHDPTPGGALRYLVKDLKVAFKELEHSGISLDVAKASCRNYQRMCDEGHGDDGTQALCWFYAGHKER